MEIYRIALSALNQYTFDLLSVGSYLRDWKDDFFIVTEADSHKIKAEKIQLTAPYPYSHKF